MGTCKSLLLSMFVVFAAACSEDVDPQVDTLFLNSGHPDSLKSQAISRLYEYYSNSDKTKAYYEVVSGRKAGDYILNYYPEAKLLTTCLDPGSGWAGQLKNVDEAALQRMANLKVKLDGLTGYVLTDSTIQHNRPLVGVKTNGSPL
jgi:hypothetical protein